MPIKLFGRIVSVHARRPQTVAKKGTPQSIVITDDKSRFVIVNNWHVSFDSVLEKLKDSWVIFDGVYMQKTKPGFEKFKEQLNANLTRFKIQNATTSFLYEFLS